MDKATVGALVGEPRDSREITLRTIRPPQPRRLPGNPNPQLPGAAESIVSRQIWKGALAGLHLNETSSMWTRPGALQLVRPGWPTIGGSTSTSPTSASRLNVVESWFGIIERQAIPRGTFPPRPHDQDAWSEPLPPRHNDQLADRVPRQDQDTTELVNTPLARWGVGGREVPHRRSRSQPTPKDSEGEHHREHRVAQGGGLQDQPGQGNHQGQQ
jgi:hypothetical protein